MRRLLLIALVLAACDASAPGGTLGLPSSRPSQTAAPATSAPPSTATATATATASPSATPSATAIPSREPSSTATATASLTPSAAPTVAPDTTRPGVAAASATQVSLTIVFSEPMRSQIPCGGSGVASAVAGAIDQRSTATSGYHSTDRALDETLGSATTARIGADCASVTFLYALAAPAGTFTVSVTGVQDLAGNAIDPARASVTVAIRDEGRPAAVAAEARGDAITVTFTEPMLLIGEGGGVTMYGNYRLDGNAPPITQILCIDAGCRTVRIELTPGSLTPGRSYNLRIANVVDRSGLSIQPDPTTLTFVAKAP